MEKGIKRVRVSEKDTGIHDTEVKTYQLRTTAKQISDNQIMQQRTG